MTSDEWYNRNANALAALSWAATVAENNYGPKVGDAVYRSGVDELRRLDPIVHFAGITINRLTGKPMPLKAADRRDHKIE